MYFKQHYCITHCPPPQMPSPFTALYTSVVCVRDCLCSGDEVFNIWKCVLNIWNIYCVLLSPTLDSVKKSDLVFEDKDPVLLCSSIKDHPALQWITPSVNVIDLWVNICTVFRIHLWRDYWRSASCWYMISSQGCVV